MGFGKVIVAVSDEKASSVIRDLAAELQFQIVSCEGLLDARRHLAQEPDTLVICDPVSFESLRQTTSNIAAILIAERGQSRQTINAMKNGAIDCLFHPIDRNELLQCLEETRLIADQPRTERSANRALATDPFAGPIVGHSPAMQEVYKQIGLIAPRDVSVLITGESGTGKELIARAIHDNSNRADKPFVPIHCAAIPETLLESELFGHEKGAFTGADARRIGRFEHAGDGTVFLDEVGDIPPPIQVKLLRVLQDRIFAPLGGNRTIRCNARIVAATHRSLETQIERGAFREDLYYRLKVATIHLPPLRDREVDAVLLAHFFAEQHNAALGANIQRFSPQAVRAILKYPWPGNVRELENAIKSALIVARGTVMRPEFLPRAIRDDTSESTATPPHEPSVKADAALPPSPLHAWIEEQLEQANIAGNAMEHVTDVVDRALIIRALDKHNGHISNTAAFLGMSRTTLRKRMQKLDISVQRRAGQD